MAGTKRSIAYLESVFETGDVPTQQNFYDLFASYLHLDDVTPKVLILALSDEITPLTSGTLKLTFRMPYAMTLTAVRASLTTAQVSGTLVTFDINKNGATVLSTKLTIDNTEKTSVTAAAPPVISVSALADNDEITVDIDAVDGSTVAAGAKIYLIGT